MLCGRSSGCGACLYEYWSAPPKIHSWRGIGSDCARRRDSAARAGFRLLGTAACVAPLQRSHTTEAMTTAAMAMRVLMLMLMVRLPLRGVS
jgi:hypothetical protein